jgi:hypothetical protein
VPTQQILLSTRLDFFSSPKCVLRRGGVLSNVPRSGKIMDLNNWCSPEEWRKERAASVFPTSASLNWFIRVNRRELVEGGVLIIGSGRAKDSVDVSRFGQVVQEIRQAKSLARLNRSADLA